MGEHEQLSTYGTLKNIFKVIYAPQKAFKEISQNPKYIGPILIMILFAAAYTGFAYIFLAKTYWEQTLPTVSQRTENSTLWVENPWIENSTLWTSNTNNITISDDYIYGSYYGNKSIEFSFANDTQVWMQLNNIGSVNCSVPMGYKNMSFRVRLIHPSLFGLKNASLYFYSSSTDIFYYNLTGNFASADNNVWSNLTISVGPENENWTKLSSNADWGNITSLRIEFACPENTSLIVRLNGLFFRGIFKSSMENITDYMLISLNAFMQFIIKWVFLGVILYIMTKAFKAKTIWKPLLILVGFALITMFIQAVINATAFSTLPTIHYPFEYVAGTKVEREIARNNILEKIWLVDQIYSYVQIAVWVWTIALCALATRLLTEFSWSKSFLVATVAYFVTMMAQSFLLGF
jgi:hypothetical protein